MYDRLMPQPRKIEKTGKAMGRPGSIQIKLTSPTPATTRDAARLERDLMEIAGIDSRPDGLPVALGLDPSFPAEGYRIEMTPGSVTLTGADEAGLFYAGQTLLQIMAFAGGQIECARIEDWPEYKTREVMVDMGRGIYPFPLLKRVVRILSRLKLNTLHLHLYDDHLNSLRFERMPLGSENPWAISIEQLGELVRYAREYHVKIVPELEAWGHAGSILHHYPELYGAPGMWEGFSFGIGEELFDLIEKILDEVVPVLEEECDVHLGLDEANWALLPSVRKEDEDKYSPELLVGRLYDILQKVGERHGRRVRMRIWADHGGRPVPAEIRDKVIVEPWQYFESREEEIVGKVARFGGKGKAPFMMGGGMSSLHLQGTYGATRIWCREGMKAPNVEGIDICMWEGNNFPDRLIGVYAGAGFAWSPLSIQPIEGDTFGEQLRGRLLKEMKKWQNTFTDAADEAIRRDMGAEVYQGIYVTGPLAGQPVTPTAILEKPRAKNSETR